METVMIHPAEAYLRNEQNPTSLYVRINGKRRRLFINRSENVIGIIAPKKRKSGYIFTDWLSEMERPDKNKSGFFMCAK